MPLDKETKDEALCISLSASASDKDTNLSLLRFG